MTGQPLLVACAVGQPGVVPTVWPCLSSDDPKRTRIPKAEADCPCKIPYPSHRRKWITQLVLFLCFFVCYIVSLFLLLSQTDMDHPVNETR
jgi:hypothetical protein